MRTRHREGGGGGEGRSASRWQLLVELIGSCPAYHSGRVIACRVTIIKHILSQSAPPTFQAHKLIYQIAIGKADYNNEESGGSGTRKS